MTPPSIAWHLGIMTTAPSRDVAVPRRALAFSLAALAAPVLAALFAPEYLGRYASLLWLTALLPAFLLAYYRGWRGVATSLAVGMATLSLTQAAAVWMGRAVPDLLLAVVVVYLAISLAIGWLAEELHKERAEAADMAFTDLLTGLPNRRHADIFLRDEFAAAQRGRTVAVVLFDLDDFKGYNDAHGHSAGDRALEAFAGVLRANTRRMNLAARYGGEEFLAILAGSNPGGAAIFADRVRAALEAQAIGDPALTVSAGVAVFNDEMADPAELLQRADAALYEAKRAGRNRVRVAGGLPDAAANPPAPRRSSPAPDSAGRRPAGRNEGRDTVAVLVVDSDPGTRTQLTEHLEHRGWYVSSTESAALGLQHLSGEYDVLVTDIHVPGGSGHEVVRAARARWPRIQILVVSALHDARVAADAVNAGADRYLFKPFDLSQFDDHLDEMLTAREAVLASAVDARPLSAEGRTREARTRAEVLKAIRALVQAVEARDPFTRGHGRGVGVLACRLAELTPGVARDVDLDLLRLSCEFHDVGKIGVPDQILNKEGTLTDDEFAVVMAHPRTGRRILEPLLAEDLVLDGVTWHHEWWDGSGYPDRLSGGDIPLTARIIAVADVVDAMSHARAFRPAMAWDSVVAHIRELRGRRFDPALVDMLLSHQDEFRALVDADEESVSGP